MPLFSIPELREEARKARNGITVAIAHADLGQGDATHILSSWAIELENYARQLGYYNIVDISSHDLVYERFTDILQNTHPSVLFNFSHGCRSYLVGNDLRCTLARGSEWDQAHPDHFACGICGMPSNLKMVSGMGIVAFSCHSAYQLGKCCVAAGSPFYIGFSDSLVITSDKYGNQNIFKETLLPLSKRILDGWPIGTAVEQTREDLLNTVKQYKIIELVSVPLWYDRKYLTQLGDPNWRLI
jgi:hypothetical protein